MVTTRKVVGAIAKSFGWMVVALNIAAGVFLVLMVFLFTADVVGRYFFSKPIHGSEQIGVFAVIFVIFLSFAYGQRQRQNVRVEFLTKRFSARGQAILDVWACSLGFLLFALIGWQGWILFSVSWQTREFMEGVASIPWYPSKFAVPLGSFLVCAQFLLDIAYRVNQLVRKEYD